MTEESDPAGERGGSAHGDEHDPLLAVVADPERGRQHLPHLLRLIDADDPVQRLRGALALCLAVEASPELLEPVVRRLVDRLDDDSPVEIPHALDYLAARRPKAVDEAVTDLAADAQVGARQQLYQSGAGYGRNEYRTASGLDAGGGRTPSDRDERTTDRNQVYRDDPRRDGLDGQTDGLDGQTDEETGGDGGGSRAEDADGSGDADRGEETDADESDESDVTRGTLALVARRLSAVVERSQFDDLNVLTERRRERFGDRYRAVGVVDGVETPLALYVFRIPEGDDAAFAGNVRQAMGAWAGVDDHDSVLTVRDWDLRPRPWAAVEHTGLTLVDRDALPPAEAVANAVDLAGAVAHAHQRGVVHGAIDPETVAYPGATLTETERQRPRLSALGLARVYAVRIGLANCLDLRYAAPEYYETRFGSVDHTTDVYALGALLYRLTTGEAPYRGSPEEIRTGVLSDRVPVPSEVDPDLPAGLDQVVRKAMAPHRLTRYETVNHFRRELRGVDTDGA
ncbi:protein kinase domain-containing protein [Halosimplex salinum]|uniref:protein kinase domain-containing protein n=1 Tax=Halosimplex salinum TaxID=1710538 RepID=UPI000F497386|nr:hypothetical protein [Halosimplex salinum]